MNRIVSLSEISNQSLLLSYNGMRDGHEKDEYYHEIVNRVLRWGVLTGQRTHMPRQVVTDIFRRHMNRTDIIIPPDRVESKLRDEYDGIDWFQDNDEEDLFKI